LLGVSFLNLMQLIYQGYHYPLLGIQKNRIEVANEYFVIVC